MTATVISNQTSFGSMTNNAVSRLISLNTSMARLKEAVATASSGYTGTPGTEFEAWPMGMPNVSGTPPMVPNNFGVQPDPENPGARGTDYSYAINQLSVQWETFWAAAVPYIEQLDNGSPSM